MLTDGQIDTKSQTDTTENNSNLVAWVVIELYTVRTSTVNARQSAATLCEIVKHRAGHEANSCIKLLSQIRYNFQQVLQDVHKSCSPHQHSIVCVLTETCNLQPITAYRPIDGISPLSGSSGSSRLLTERGPGDRHHGRGAAHFLASFIAFVIGLQLQVARCMLQPAACKF